MPYSDKAYFLLQMKESALNNLIKDDTGEPDDDILTNKILVADNIINNYLSKVIKTLPLVTPPDAIKQYSYNITIYYLHSRVQPNMVPEIIVKLKDDAIDDLRKISEGAATLFGVETGNEPTSNVSYSVDENKFSQDNS